MKKIIITTLSLMIICAVSALLLALTNNATANQILQRSEDSAAAAKTTVLSQAASFDEIEVTLNGQTYDCFEGKDKDSDTVGYVITTSANGYVGPIKIMFGVLTDGTISGMEILEISETSGLGMNANNKEFKDQFSGLISGINVVKGEAGANEIKAITGATITSKTVVKAANEALEVYEEIAGGVE